MPRLIDRPAAMSRRVHPVRDHDYMGRTVMWLLAFIAFGAIIAFTWFDLGAPHSQKERSATQTPVPTNVPKTIWRPLPRY